jgi:hypothetical protein
MLPGIVAFVGGFCFIVGVNLYYAVKLKTIWRDLIK